MKATELVKDWLANEGYKCTVDEDGDLFFKYQGFNMWVAGDPNDPLFLRVIMPNVYEVEGDRVKVLEALNKVNEGIKSVKGFIAQNNHVWMSIEMYVDSSPELEDFFERCLDIILASGRKFAAELQEN